TVRRAQSCTRFPYTTLFRSDSDTLEWMTDKVEGNLLAAFQEVQKLGLLYPAGKISASDVERAVLNVARYDVFGLRDAMLTGHARSEEHTSELQSRENLVCRL